MISRAQPGFRQAGIPLAVKIGGVLSALVLLLSLAACAPRTASRKVAGPHGDVVEQPIRQIFLRGELGEKTAEISGLAWCGERLILLPQYPERFAAVGEGCVFALEKDEILAYLDERSPEPLTARRIPFQARGLETLILGYEGYEAIAFHGQRVFLTIEAKRGAKMVSYLVSGEMAADLGGLRIDTGHLVEIPAQAEIANMSYEALVVANDTLVTLYELNGANINPDPHAYLFDMSLRHLGTVPCPTIEYRITDATEMDAARRFWVVNFFYPGDERLLRPARDLLAAEYGQGPTHQRCLAVERLVEYRFTAGRIVRTDAPPIQLQIVDDANCRNWEGIARLEDRGFLLMTDTYPETILGFVPFE
jgi:hypothetical protein